MATEVIMPRVDMEMVEGKVAHWYVAEGDAVRKGQVLFEIETDKATMEVDATSDGVIRGIKAELGVAIPVGEVIGWILAPDEAVPGVAAPAGAVVDGGADDAPASSVSTPAAATDEPVRAAAQPDRLLRATPLARTLAREHRLDLGAVVGSGPAGRVLGCDVVASIGAGSAPAAAAPAEVDAGDHLHVYRAGRGAPIVLIHGFGADQGGWRPLVQALVEVLDPDRPVLAVDLPGHGRSAFRPVESIDDLARAVISRLDLEGTGACHLVGHSLGGGVALAIARIAPARVASLTLLAPLGLGDEVDGRFAPALVGASSESALRQAMLPLFHDAQVLSASFVATALRQLDAAGRREALAGIADRLMPQGRQAPALRRVLDATVVPAQVIWGTGDRIIPSRHAFDLPAHVAVHLLPRVGHLPQVEAAPIVASLVAHQLRQAG